MKRIIMPLAFILAIAGAISTQVSAKVTTGPYYQRLKPSGTCQPLSFSCDEIQTPLTCNTNYNFYKPNASSDCGNPVVLYKIVP